MRAYIYAADLHCEDCALAIREELTRHGLAPADPHLVDNDDWPDGPYPDGGGETDCPAHCGSCGVYLDAPLTDDGVDYVLDALLDYICDRSGDPNALDEWALAIEDYQGFDTRLLTAYHGVRSRES